MFRSVFRSGGDGRAVGGEADATELELRTDLARAKLGLTGGGVAAVGEVAIEPNDGERRGLVAFETEGLDAETGRAVGDRVGEGGMIPVRESRCELTRETGETRGGGRDWGGAGDNGLRSEEADALEKRS